MFSDPQKNIAQLGLEDGMKVADFGVGSGAYSVAAAQRVGGAGKVYAIDVQSDLLTKVKNLARQEGVDNLEIIRGDVDEPGGATLRDASVDVVIVSNILFQSENKTVLAGEAFRVLKPDGRVLVVDWTASHGGMGPETGAVVSKELAQNIFEEAGFVFDRDIDTGEYHYGFIVRKVRS